MPLCLHPAGPYASQAVSAVWSGQRWPRCHHTACHLESQIGKTPTNIKHQQLAPCQQAQSPHQDQHCIFKSTVSAVIVYCPSKDSSAGQYRKMQLDELLKHDSTLHCSNLLAHIHRFPNLGVSGCYAWIPCRCRNSILSTSWHLALWKQQMLEAAYLCGL